MYSDCPPTLFDSRAPELPVGAIPFGATQSDPAIAPGQAQRVAHPNQVGPYRLGRRLGSGGMADVFVGVDERTGAECAVKVTRLLRGGEAITMECFRSEVGALERLNHPNVVRLLADGRADDGRLYLAMPLIPGRSLRALLAGARQLSSGLRERFVRRRLLPLLVQLCDALQHTHEQGVIHRDLKPANVMIGRNGQAVLIDFGIARRLSADAPPSGEPTDASQLKRPSFGGTPGYMAPEQILGHPDQQDGRSDVFGLGAILFELIGRGRLFQADSSPGLLRATLAGNTGCLAERVDPTPLSAALLPVVERAIAPSPSDRWPDARSMREAIVRALDSLDAAPPPFGWTPDWAAVA